MPFDSNNNADLLALKSELQNDPIGMGYNLNGSQAKVAEKLNDPAANVGGETVARTFDASAMMDALDPNDLDAQQTNARAGDYIQMLLTLGSGFNSIESYKTKFRDLFAANSTTVAALDAQTELLSRAVVLFGAGSTITENDIGKALAAV